MGTEIFSLRTDRENPLVTGIGFILTIVYAFLITSYLETITSLIISSKYELVELSVLLIVSIATTGYLIYFAVENYLWTEQYERPIAPKEYWFELTQHGVHILGTLLLFGFVESQNQILSQESIDIHLFLFIPILALAIRYLLFATWQTISIYRDIPKNYRLHIISIWATNPNILENETKWIKKYAGIVDWFLSILYERSIIVKQNQTRASIKKINSVRNSVCAIPFYLIMFFIHLGIVLAACRGVFPENICSLLIVPLLIVVYMLPYYIIWRPFIYQLLNVTEKRPTYHKAG